MLTFSGPSCSTTAADHIYAVGQGSVKSDSQSASLNQHTKYGFFSFDVASAKGGDDVNPFISTSSTTNSGGTSSGGTSCSTGSASSSSGSGFPWFNGGSRPSGFPGGPFRNAKRDDCSLSPAAALAQAQLNSYRMRLIAHGILAGLCFAILFPLGAISIRLFSFPGLVWFHAGLQIMAQIIFIIAFALGITLARDRDLVRHSEFHKSFEYHSNFSTGQRISSSNWYHSLCLLAYPANLWSIAPYEVQGVRPTDWMVSCPRLARSNYYYSRYHQWRSWFQAGQQHSHRPNRVRRHRWYYVGHLCICDICWRAKEGGKCATTKV
jgi:hypothetical protein